ncbi:hypothetical protein GUJ93_ZPchr0010g11093 [Zizania palustris]|uniref:Secreted protein n=1 Tax=Zizania palustris TaxID=103762 RepID=A0A8J5W758_ZIZPA|nr:hypothetical protein GUJ93_ZPchr0010g11093 [Zizania palustris]
MLPCLLIISLLLIVLGGKCDDDIERLWRDEGSMVVGGKGSRNGNSGIMWCRCWVVKLRLSDKMREAMAMAGGGGREVVERM